MLKMQVQVLVLVLLCAVARGRVFERCEWAQILKEHDMDRYRGMTIADWVCLTEHESNHDTAAVNHNRDGSTDYGIFQINSKYWCRDGGPSRANGCGIDCSELLSDDPTTAINCAKRVVMDPQGPYAWVAWRLICDNKDLTKYVAGCGV